MLSYIGRSKVCAVGLFFFNVAAAFCNGLDNLVLLYLCHVVSPLGASTSLACAYITTIRLVVNTFAYL